MSFKILVDDDNCIGVDDRCKQFIVGEFQTALFAERGYNMPSPEVSLARLQKIIKSMKDRNIEINSDTLSTELKSEVKQIYIEHKRKNELNGFRY